MINSIPYFRFLGYSPRKDTSEVGIKSRLACGQIKACNALTINRIFERIRENPPINALTEFLNDDILLVPIPKSTPIKGDTIWPAQVLCQSLIENGYASELNPLIERISPIRKSALQRSAEERPSVEEHLESLSINRQLGLERDITERDITLVDDVVTLGRTSIACAIKLNELFPKARIRLVSFVRTMGFVDQIEDVFNPSTGVISYNLQTQKTSREP